MESPERTTGPPDGPYPEEMLLEAYELEWEAIELRRQRLRKTWQQFQLIHEMEVEELKYQRQQRRIMAQEKEREEKLEELEALRCENEKQAALIKEKERREELAALMKEKERRERLKQEALRREEEEAALIKEKERLRAEKALIKEKERLRAEKALVKEKERLRAEKRRLKAEKQKRMKQVEASDLQTDEEDPRKHVKVKVKVKKKKKKVKQAVASDSQTDDEDPRKHGKVKKIKDTAKNQQGNKTKAKRVIPVSLPPPPQPEPDDSFSEENQVELGGYDSPPPELPDDGLLDMLSFEKSSDSDIDDEPTMVSLILPAAQSSPKQAQPLYAKKNMTPQKRFAKKGGPPLDFDFTNAEAKRQAAAAKAAEHDAVDESDSEPEPMPAPLTPTPQKRLKRRKEVAKERQNTANTTAVTGRTNLMAAMANSTITIKPKKKALADKAKPTVTAGNNLQKKTGGAQAKAKPQTKEKDMVEEEEIPTTPVVKKKSRGNSEKLTIKQRLANAELLARMSKMQDINTPKVLGKKTKNGQKKAATKTLAAKRAEFRKALASEEATDPDVHRGDEGIEDRDLNISLNSSGLTSDNDSPGKLRAPTRKRPREAVDGDVTPAKKLQFLEITKRLTKSPMPRFLRTPTPLMSPVIASAALNPRAASPARRMTSSRATADKAVKDATRRMNSAPVRPKKTTNVNRFGAPASTAASSGGFSMFDAFVNSGSSGAIPRLKTKTRGDVSPSV